MELICVSLRVEWDSDEKCNRWGNPLSAFLKYVDIVWYCDLSTILEGDVSTFHLVNHLRSSIVT